MKRGIHVPFVLLRCVAAGFAFYATAKHPYNFYVVTRWVVFLTCCWGLWSLGAQVWRSFGLGYIAIGLIFNPLFPFHFQRSIWHTLDIAAGAILLLSIAYDWASRDATTGDD